FENVLSVEKVGIKDNFFELGGDSIKAIRVVSKIRELGYELTVKELLKGKNIEKIKSRLKVSNEEKSYSQDNILGKIPFTPIQNEFNTWNLVNKNHFNLSTMIKMDKFNEEALKETLKAIIIHHDMLRAVYKDNIQQILEINEDVSLDMKIFTYGEQSAKECLEDVEMKCNEIQKSINIENGSLIKFGLFKFKDEEHLLICIHHLVADGISLRIILEDIEDGYNQYIKEGKIQLKKKTASYKDWAEALVEYAESNKLKKEENYWKQVNDKINDCGSLEIKCKDKKYDNIMTELDISNTRQLLTRAGKAYNTEINDLLLAALILTINKVNNKKKIALSLEGHGREEIHKKISIERTVGWFTSIYPIVLETNGEIEDTIIQTKEMIRNIPNKGIGYGVLKYNSKNNALDAVPNISFNYFGEIGTELKDGINISDLPKGDEIGDNVNINDLIINIIKVDGKLQVNFTYNTFSFNKEYINELGNKYIDSIKDIIKLCTSRKKSVKTKSDFANIGLNIKDIEKINKLADLFNKKK
ncbi:MAG: condensation domain-containing protein, partial [Clostridium sp.]